MYGLTFYTGLNEISSFFSSTNCNRRFLIANRQILIIVVMCKTSDKLGSVESTNISTQNLLLTSGFAIVRTAHHTRRKCCISCFVYREPRCRSLNFRQINVYYILALFCVRRGCLKRGKYSSRWRLLNIMG